jgi:hypothetical protein
MTQKALRDLLRICQRARNSAHIDDDADLRSSEQIDKFADRARGMADMETSSWLLGFRIRAGPSAGVPLGEVFDEALVDAAVFLLR